MKRFFALLRNSRIARWLFGLLLLAILLFAGYLWLRDSSFVSVEKVKITGLHGRDSIRIRGAIEGAAYGMTTLHVDEAAIRKAVEPFPTVAGLEITTSFPHELRVRIIPRRVVALVSVAGRKIPVDLDGKILKGQAPRGQLPVVVSQRVPGTERITDQKTLDELAVLKAGPVALTRRVAQVSTSAKGLTVALRKGPKLYFGAAADLDRKWAAAARVLADPQVAGATYIDVQVPGRPAIGGKGPTVTDTTATDPTAAPVATEPVVPEAAESVPAPVPDPSATPDPTVAQ